MKTVLLQETSKEQRKDLGFPNVNNQLRKINNVDIPSTIWMGWSTPIVDGGITLANPLDTCRERLIGAFRDWIFPGEPTVKRYVTGRMYSRGFAWVSGEKQPNPTYGAAKILGKDKKIRFVLFVKGPYPRKDTRPIIETLRDNMTAGAEKARILLNNLEKKAGWSKTKVYSLDCRPCLKGGHVIGFMFEADPMWGDNPALLSLFTLICRAVTRADKAFTKACLESVDTFAEKAKETLEGLSSVPYWERYNDPFGPAASDLRRIEESAWCWEKFLKNYSKIRGKSTRKKLFGPYESTGMIVDGISNLSMGRGRDKDFLKKFRKHVGENPTKKLKKVAQMGRYEGVELVMRASNYMKSRNR